MSAGQFAVFPQCTEHFLSPPWLLSLIAAVFIPAIKPATVCSFSYLSSTLDLHSWLAQAVTSLLTVTAINKGNQDSSVGVLQNHGWYFPSRSVYKIDRIKCVSLDWNSIPIRGYVFFSENLRLNPVPPQLPCSMDTRCFCPNPKWLQCHTDRSPLPNADVKFNYDLFNIVRNWLSKNMHTVSGWV
jgi:hypothetical protein